MVQGHVSPEFAIPSIPQVAQPKARPRKRKQLFDEATVLTNKYGFEEDSYEIFPLLILLALCPKWD